MSSFRPFLIFSSFIWPPKLSIYQHKKRKDCLKCRLLIQEKGDAPQSPNLADSLSDKNSIDSKAANSLFPGEGGGGRGAEILRIPRPSTTVSLSTVIGESQGRGEEGGGRRY